MAAHARRAADERGVVVPLVAIALVALLAVTALAIDGGMAYAQRRSMQNASDAAAMAGTRMVDKIRFTPEGQTQPANSAIYDAVQRELDDYGVESAQCWLVVNDVNHTVVSGDFCADPTILNGVDLRTATFTAANLRVAGVKVTATDTRELFLGAFVEKDELSASAKATAAVQPFVQGGAAPFLVCGRSDLAPGNAYDILDASNSVKVSAIDGWFPLQLSQLYDCGSGSEFKGKGPDDGVSINAWVRGDNGNGFEADIKEAVAGLTPCPAGGPFNGCGMLIPIASQGCGGAFPCPPGVPNGGKPNLYLVTWTVWEVYGNGTGNTPQECEDNFSPPEPKYCGKLLGTPPPVLGGGGGTGDVWDSSQARALNLVE